MGKTEARHIAYCIRRQIDNTFPSFTEVRRSKLARRKSMALKHELKLKRLPDITPERMAEAEAYVTWYIKGLRHEYWK